MTDPKRAIEVGRTVCPGCEKTVGYLLKSKDENGLTFRYCLSCVQKVQARIIQHKKEKGLTSEKVPQKASQTPDLCRFSHKDIEAAI